MAAVFDILSSPLKSYITQYLQYYLSKYIEDIRLDGLGVFGRDIVLYDLEIKRDVLRSSLDIPPSFDFVRGFIRELRISIPWTQLLSLPIEVKLYTIELILRAQEESQQSTTKHEEAKLPEISEKEEAATSWLQDLLKKVLVNISIQINNLVLKYEQDDIVLSLALGMLDIFSAKAENEWTKAFVEPKGIKKVFHKAIQAKDITIFLDRYEKESSEQHITRKVLGYEVPVLHRTNVTIKTEICLDPTASMDQNEVEPIIFHQRVVNDFIDPYYDILLTDFEEKKVASLKDILIDANDDKSVPTSISSSSLVPKNLPVALIVDIYIQNLDFSLSDRQLSMLGKFAVLESQLAEKVKREKEKRRPHTSASCSCSTTFSRSSCSYCSSSVISDSKSSILSPTKSTISSRFSSNRPVLSSPSTVTAARSTPTAPLSPQDKSSGWLDWAFDMVSGNDEDDPLVAELLVEGNSKIEKLASINQRKYTLTHRFNLCISKASFTLRKLNKNQQPEEELQGEERDEREAFVPVANLGLVKIPFAPSKQKKSKPPQIIGIIKMKMLLVQVKNLKEHQREFYDIHAEIQSLSIDSDENNKVENCLSWGNFPSFEQRDFVMIAHPSLISSLFSSYFEKHYIDNDKGIEIFLKQSDKMRNDEAYPVWVTNSSINEILESDRLQEQLTEPKITILSELVVQIVQKIEKLFVYDESLDWNLHKFLSPLLEEAVNNHSSFGPWNSFKINQVEQLITEILVCSLTIKSLDGLKEKLEERIILWLLRIVDERKTLEEKLENKFRFSCSKRSRETTLRIRVVAFQDELKKEQGQEQERSWNISCDGSISPIKLNLSTPLTYHICEILSGFHQEIKAIPSYDIPLDSFVSSTATDSSDNSKISFINLLITAPLISLTVSCCSCQWDDIEGDVKAMRQRNLILGINRIRISSLLENKKEEIKTNKELLLLAALDSVDLSLMSEPKDLHPYVKDLFWVKGISISFAKDISSQSLLVHESYRMKTELFLNQVGYSFSSDQLNASLWSVSHFMNRLNNVICISCSSSQALHAELMEGYISYLFIQFQLEEKVPSSYPNATSSFSCGVNVGDIALYTKNPLRKDIIKSDSTEMKDFLSLTCSGAYVPDFILKFVRDAFQLPKISPCLSHPFLFELRFFISSVSFHWEHYLHILYLLSQIQDPTALNTKLMNNEVVPKTSRALSLTTEELGLDDFTSKESPIDEWKFRLDLQLEDFLVLLSDKVSIEIGSIMLQSLKDETCEQTLLYLPIRSIVLKCLVKNICSPIVTGFAKDYLLKPFDLQGTIDFQHLPLTEKEKEIKKMASTSIQLALKIEIVFTGLEFDLSRQKYLELQKVFDHPQNQFLVNPFMDSAVVLPPVSLDISWSVHFSLRFSRLSLRLVLSDHKMNLLSIVSREFVTHIKVIQENTKKTRNGKDYKRRSRFSIDLNTCIGDLNIVQGRLERIPPKLGNLQRLPKSVFLFITLCLSKQELDSFAIAIGFQKEDHIRQEVEKNKFTSSSEALNVLRNSKRILEYVRVIQNKENSRNLETVSQMQPLLWCRTSHRKANEVTKNPLFSLVFQLIQESEEALDRLQEGTETQEEQQLLSSSIPFSTLLKISLISFDIHLPMLTLLAIVKCFSVDSSQDAEVKVEPIFEQENEEETQDLDLYENKNQDDWSWLNDLSVSVSTGKIRCFLPENTLSLCLPTTAIVIDSFSIISSKNSLSNFASTSVLSNYPLPSMYSFAISCSLDNCQILVLHWKSFTEDIQVNLDEDEFSPFQVFYMKKHQIVYLVERKYEILHPITLSLDIYSNSKEDNDAKTENKNMEITFSLRVSDINIIILKKDYDCAVSFINALIQENFTCANDTEIRNSNLEKASDLNSTFSLLFSFTLRSFSLTLFFDEESVHFILLNLKYDSSKELLMSIQKFIICQKKLLTCSSDGSYVEKLLFGPSEDASYWYLSDDVELPSLFSLKSSSESAIATAEISSFTVDVDFEAVNFFQNFFSSSIIVMEKRQKNLEKPGELNKQKTKIPTSIVEVLLRSSILSFSLSSGEPAIVFSVGKVLGKILIGEKQKTIEKEQKSHLNQILEFNVNLECLQVGIPRQFIKREFWFDNQSHLKNKVDDNFTIDSLHPTERLLLPITLEISGITESFGNSRTLIHSKYSISCSELEIRSSMENIRSLVQIINVITSRTTKNNNMMNISKTSKLTNENKSCSSRKELSEQKRGDKALETSCLTSTDLASLEQKEEWRLPLLGELLIQTTPLEEIIQIKDMREYIKAQALEKSLLSPVAVHKLNEHGASISVDSFSVDFMDEIWSYDAEEQDGSMKDQQLNTILRQWIPVRWKYEVPHRVVRLLVKPLPISQLVRSLWPKEQTSNLLIDGICELRYYDEEMHSFRTLADFPLPLEQIDSKDEEQPSFSFVEALNSWVDSDSVKEKNASKPLNASYQIDILKVKPSDYWELRWRLPIKILKKTSTEDLLSLISSFCSSIQVQSVFVPLDFCRVSLDVSFPRVVVSVLTESNSLLESNEELVLLAFTDSFVRLTQKNNDLKNKTHINISSSILVIVKNLTTLSQLEFIEQTRALCCWTIEEKQMINLYTSPIRINLTNTMLLTAQYLQQTIQEIIVNEENKKRSKEMNSKKFGILLRNCTSVSVWYGQEHTQERCCLPFPQEAFYSWLGYPREAKGKVFRLHFAIEEKERDVTDPTQQETLFSWCEGVPLNETGVYCRELGSKYVLWISIEFVCLKTIVTLRSSHSFINRCDLPLELLFSPFSSCFLRPTPFQTAKGDDFPSSINIVGNDWAYTNEEKDNNSNHFFLMLEQSQINFKLRSKDTLQCHASKEQQEQEEWSSAISLQVPTVELQFIRTDLGKVLTPSSNLKEKLVDWNHKISEEDYQTEEEESENEDQEDQEGNKTFNKTITEVRKIVEIRRRDSNSIWLWVVCKRLPVWTVSTESKSCSSLLGINSKSNKQLRWGWISVEFYPVFLLTNTLSRQLSYTFYQERLNEQLQEQGEMTAEQDETIERQSHVFFYSNPFLDYIFSFGALRSQIRIPASLLFSKRISNVVLKDQLVLEKDNYCTSLIGRNFSLSGPCSFLRLVPTLVLINKSTETLWIVDSKNPCQLLTLSSQTKVILSISQDFKIGLKEEEKHDIVYSSSFSCISFKDEVIISIRDSKQRVKEFLLRLASTSSSATVAIEVYHRFLLTNKLDFSVVLCPPNQPEISSQEQLLISMDCITPWSYTTSCSCNSCCSFTIIVDGDMKARKKIEFPMCPKRTSSNSLSRVFISNHEGKSFLVSLFNEKKEGTIHFLFFHDPQPPVFLNNTLKDHSLEILIEQSQENRLLLLPQKEIEYDWDLLQLQKKTNEKSNNKIENENPIEKEAVKKLNDKKPLFPSLTSSRSLIKFQVKLKGYSNYSKILWDAPGIQFASLTKSETCSCVTSCITCSCSITTLLIHIYLRKGSCVVTFYRVDEEFSLSFGDHFGSLKNNQEDCPADEPLPLLGNVSIPLISLSVYDEELPINSNGLGFFLKELLHLSIKNINWKLDQSRIVPPFLMREANLGNLSFVETFSVQELTVEEMQLDHFVEKCNFPVLFKFDNQKKQNNHENLFNGIRLEIIYLNPYQHTQITGYFEQIKVNISPFLIQLEDILILHLLHVFSPLLEAVTKASIPTSVSTSSLSSSPSLCVSVPVSRVYIGNLFISEILCTITLRVSVRVYVGLYRTPLVFAPVELSPIYACGDDFIKELAANYVADAIIRSHLVLGSLDFLGNPTGFFRSISLGLIDLIRMPVDAAFHDWSPWGILCGLANGSSSFARHFSSGVLNSISAFTYSLARNLDQVVSSEGNSSLDRYSFIAPRPLSDGIRHGVQGLGESLVDAASGIITTPLAVYTHGRDQGHQIGFGGVLKGVGKGLLGVVVKPMGGMAALVSHTTLGILTSTGIEEHPQVFRDSINLYSATDRSLRFRWKLFSPSHSFLYYVDAIWKRTSSNQEDNNEIHTDVEEETPVTLVFVDTIFALVLMNQNLCEMLFCQLPLRQLHGIRDYPDNPSQLDIVFIESDLKKEPDIKKDSESQLQTFSFLLKKDDCFFLSNMLYDTLAQLASEEVGSLLD